MDKVINIINSKENTDSQRRLFELIASGDSVLMVGAGSSKIVGYSLWSELIKELENEAYRIVDDSSTQFSFRPSPIAENDLIYASRLKKFITDPYYNALIHRLFDGSKGFDDCHVKLLELPFRGIVTTNYDHLLESAFFKAKGIPAEPIVLDEVVSANRELNRFFESLNYGYGTKNLVTHLHGSFKNPQSIVLCQEDYEKRYGNFMGSTDWPLHKRSIWALMATRRLVYVGFSMTDPFFQMMHNIVSVDFGTFGLDTHYLVTRFSTDDENESAIQLGFAQRLKKRFGIQVVFFEDDKSYVGLKKYLNELSNQVIGLLTKDSMATKKIKPNTGFEINNESDEAVTRQLEKRSRVKNKKIRESEY